MNLTAANQLTILRMLLIPAFVILLLYGYRAGRWSRFLVAGITDAARRPDRAAARARRPRSAPGSIRWPTSCCW